jgi:GNAT superfamily N-acetyltransferase
VGFAIADVQGHSIWAWFGHPDFDGPGIGQTLHNAMLKWCFAQTAKTLWLSTAPGTRAEGVYRRAGWHSLGLKSNGEVKFEMTGPGAVATRASKSGAVPHQRLRR